MNEKKLVKGLNKVLTQARKVTMYQELYKDFPKTLNSLESFKKLPTISDFTLCSQRLEDTVVDMSKIDHVLYPLGKDMPSSQIPRVIDLPDIEIDYELTEFIVGYTEYQKKKEHRMMMLADDANSYFIGELGFQIHMLNHPLAMMTVQDHTPKQIKEKLDIMKPTMLFMGMNKPIAQKLIPESTDYVLTFNNLQPYKPIDKNGKRHFDYFDVYTHDMMGLVAVYDDELECYAYNPDQYYIEINKNNQMIITSFINEFQPMVRYKTKSFAKLIESADTGEGRFKLYYNGEAR